MVNKQREVIYGLRRDALTGAGPDRAPARLHGERRSARIFAETCPENEPPDFWNMDELALRFQGLVLAPLPLAENEHLETGCDALRGRAGRHARSSASRPRTSAWVRT